MATIQVVLGVLCITYPLLPGVGVSLAVCVIGPGLLEIRKSTWSMFIMRITSTTRTSRPLVAPRGQRRFTA